MARNQAARTTAYNRNPKHVLPLLNERHLFVNPADKDVPRDYVKRRVSWILNCWRLLCGGFDHKPLEVFLCDFVDGRDDYIPGSLARLQVNAMINVQKRGRRSRRGVVPKASRQVPADAKLKGCAPWAYRVYATDIVNRNVVTRIAG